MSDDSDQKKSIDEPLPPVIKERLPTILIVTFIVGLLFSFSTHLGVCFLFFILGLATLYPLYTSKPDLFNITKICAIVLIFFGIGVILTGLSTDLSNFAVYEYASIHKYELYSPSSPNIVENARNILIAHAISLVISGLVIAVFGYLAYRQTQSQSESLFSKYKHILTYLIALVCFIAVILIIANSVSQNSTQTTNVIVTTIPTPITTITLAPTTLPTTIQTFQYSELSCNIAGKWIQQNVAGYVYLQLYSDKRIEIYLSNELRSWGTYDVIAPNQIRHTWSGGVDTGAGNTITVSSDCQSLDVVSFQGEHSTFTRA